MMFRYPEHTGDGSVGEAATITAAAQGKSVAQARRWHEADGVVTLLGSRCRECGLCVFPAASLCRRCWPVGTMEEIPLSPWGVLYSWTLVHVAPAEFSPPYALGYIDLPEGVRVLGQIDEPPTGLRAGMRLNCRIGPVRVAPDGSPVLGYRFAGEHR